MAVNDAKKEVVRVPYTSFKTLLNTADRMKEQGGAPSRVDRSYLSNMPGGERGIFTTALKTTELVNDSLEPTDDLHALIEGDEEVRKEVVHQILERVYPEALALPKRATQDQLEKTFREYGVSGSTLRRAIGFFLAATEFAGIERSPHFKLPKRERAARPRAKPETPAVVTPETPPPPKGETDALNPFIVGLVTALPSPGEVFPSEKRESWLAAAKNVFDLIYKTGSDSTEARPEPSNRGVGDEKVNREPDDAP